MGIADIELVTLLTMPRPDIAIVRMIVADVELLALARLDVILVHERFVTGCLGISHAAPVPASPKI